MDRREAFSVVSILLGSKIPGSGSFLSDYRSSPRRPLRGLLNIDEKLLLDEASEAILPKTGICPGDKAII